MTHKAKVKLARRLQTKDERYGGLFYSKAWQERKWRKMSEHLPQVVVYQPEAEA